jgi:nitroreductase
MNKTADVDFPIHELMAERWSPIAFGEGAVDDEALGSLLEAARWAPSSFNEQPWSLLVARRDDAAAFGRLAACLVEGNSWAQDAAVLLLGVAATQFSRNGKANRHAHYDLGQAFMSMALQAQALGLVTHQMAGFDADKARTTLDVPEGHDALVMMAVGHPGDVSRLPVAMAQREAAARSRKRLDDFVYGAGWGSAFALKRS